MPKDNYYLPQRNLVTQKEGAVIEAANVPRSRFHTEWQRYTAFDAGLLVPILVDEVLPGDHLRYNIHAYVRMSTPLFPLFTNQRIDTFFFFVPCRILWDNWVRFMGEQDSPTDSIAFTLPKLQIARQAIGTIYDHMGLPALVGQFPTALETISVNALPLRAYNMIWNQWFRDQNVQSGLNQRKGDGGDVDTDYAIRGRAKSHDYFTSALPWAQKFTAPNVPVAGLAPVSGIGFEQGFSGTHNVTANQTLPLAGGQAWTNAVRGTDATTLAIRSNPADASTPYVFADLSLATGVAINTFRQAFLIQQLLERDARGGTRYTELIWSHFKVRNPDYRLQRPEYIGGGKSQLNVTPIAQTAPTDDAPLGALGGAATAAGQHTASYAATEHGYIIGLINIRTEQAYQQGISRLWTRTTRYDFYFPSTAQLGEQAILRKEIYCIGDPAFDDLAFAYQERWHELRTRTSEVTGIMRSFATGTIDQWHLTQRYTAPPTFGGTFLHDNPPMARVLAAGDLAIGQQYIANILYSRDATRPIPMYGTPAILGRF